jgi:hypothetical protein
MIQNVSTTKPGFFLDVIRIQNMQGGRISVPVNPAHVVYARFRHIQGVPAQNGGAPLFRLRVLDNLIDRLLQYNEKVPDIMQLKSMEAESIDPLISEFQNRLRSRVLQFPPAFGGGYSETGMLIDLSA